MLNLLLLTVVVQRSVIKLTDKMEPIVQIISDEMFIVEN